MQQAWQNFAGANGGAPGSMGGSFSLSGSNSTLAGLQNGTNPFGVQLGGKANIPGINAVELPSWLSKTGGDIHELTDTYSRIGSAFDPTGQVKARNDAISYNTSAGTQAANNAATEYSARAAQSGASTLGAGAVKAQAMMPVFSQNAQLKTDAADVAAKAHQQGVALAGQIAGTIGELRSSYLSMMTGYAQGQQKLALDKYTAEQQAALGGAKLQADAWTTSMSNQKQSDEQKRLAAMGLLSLPQSSGQWMDDALTGRITDGQDSYARYQQDQRARDAARASLLGML